MLESYQQDAFYSAMLEELKKRGVVLDLPAAVVKYGKSAGWIIRTVYRQYTGKF